MTERSRGSVLERMGRWLRGGDASTSSRSEPASGPARARPGIRLAELNMASFTVETERGPMEAQVNVDALKVKNRADYPWHWCIVLKALDVRADGLPTAKERKVLDALFDRMMADLTLEHPVLVIGRNTLAGNHEVWFYSDMMAGGPIVDMKGSYPEEGGRLVNFRGREDPTWALVEAYLQEAVEA